jgi:2,4-dichlorophenol 6-monooxygenase
VGDWHKVRDIRDGGCILVRPDHHVAWRSQTSSNDPAGELTRVLHSILGH